MPQQLGRAASDAPALRVVKKDQPDRVWASNTNNLEGHYTLCNVTKRSNLGQDRGELLVLQDGRKERKVFFEK